VHACGLQELLAADDVQERPRYYWIRNLRICQEKVRDLRFKEAGTAGASPGATRTDSKGGKSASRDAGATNGEWENGSPSAMLRTGSEASLQRGKMAG
jgi:hypothetical protein